MKLTIEDGRNALYTYDTNRVLILTATDEENIVQVEFSTEDANGTVSWTSEVLVGEDGIKYVQIPNEFLNGDYNRLVCYAVSLDSNGQYTRDKEIFRIRPRQEPQDYYLTYSERVTFASIKALTEEYKASAQSYMESAERSEGNASDSADLARRYAEEAEDVEVEAGRYSSKHWSIKSNKKFDELKEYVGNSSDPSTVLGSIEESKRFVDEARENAHKSMTVAEQAKTDAIDAKNAAETSETNAGKSEQNVSNMKSAIEQMQLDVAGMKEVVITANNSTVKAANAASDSEENALTYMQNAQQAKSAAETAESGAEKAKGIAENAKSEAMTARNETVQAKKDVEAIKAELDKCRMVYRNNRIYINVTEETV